MTRKKLLDLYDDAKQTINTFLFSVSIWCDHKVGVRTPKLYLVNSSPVSETRLLINNIACILTRMNEDIKDLAKDEQEEYEKKLSALIMHSKAYKKLTFSSNIPDVKKQQEIRNCLAHARFSLIEDEQEPFTYNYIFKTDIMNGILKNEDIFEIVLIFEKIRNSMLKDYKHFKGLEELLNLKTGNYQLLNNILNNIVVIEYNQNGMSTRPLLPEEKKIITAYIKYIGIHNWVKLPKTTKEEIVKNVILKLLSSKNEILFDIRYVMYPLYNATKNLSHNGVVEYEKMFYMTPIAYSSSLLELCFFTFNYLEEAQRKNNIEGFSYLDLSTREIKVSYPTKQEVIKEINGSDYIDIELTPILKELATSQKKLTQAQKQQSNLEKAKENPKITELLEGIKMVIATLEEQIKLLETKKSELESRKTKEPNHYDYQSLINHIRNSLAHGFYKVDYLEALEKKSLDLITFHFEDYIIDKKTRQRTKTFECKITGRMLQQLIEKFADRFENVFIHDENRPVHIGVNLSQESQELHTLAEEELKRIEQEYKITIRI